MLRKLIPLFLAALSLLLCPVEARAASDPGSLWQSGSYPSDVSYAYCSGTDGQLQTWEIGLVNGSDARQQELRDLFPDCSITFTECVVSFSERTAILDGILQEKDNGIISGALLLDSEEILVMAENSQASKYASLYQREYGSIVVVTDQDGNIPGNAEAPTMSFRTLLIILAAAAFVIIFVNRYSRLKKERLERDD